MLNIVENYFDLIRNSNLNELAIVPYKDKYRDCYDCQLISNETKQIYNGFLLAESPEGNSRTICDISFQKSSNDNKYQARLTFRKTDRDLKDKRVRSDINQIIIPFCNGQQGYREFWKMIVFLYKWRETIDLGEYDDYFSITDKSLASALQAISKFENKDIVVKSLKRLSNQDLRNIDNLVNTSKFKLILEEWETNKNNNQEVGFWQKFFKIHHWILPQIFATNVTLMGEEFYVGGISQGQRGGGKYTDFATKNKLNQTIALIEIKTPTKQLVSTSEYDKRVGIYSMTTDLTGAITQVLNQKDLVQKDFKHDNAKKNYKVLNPRCILLIGSKEREQMNEDQEACFELFRNTQKDVEIITFDELFLRIKSILEIFETQDNINSSKIEN